jgi:hypothetical protein
MAIRIGKKALSAQITITNESPEIAGHPWAENDWSITGETVGREKTKKIVSDNEDDYDRYLFSELVKSWTGFVDDDGEPIPCTEEVKLAFYDAHNYFVGRVFNAMANEKMRAAIVEEEKEKN